MQIFVKTLEGKYSVMEISPNNLIGEVKQKIQEKENIPVNIQRLIFSGIQLEDHFTLKHYSIFKDSVILLLLRLKGGVIGSKSPSIVIGLIPNDDSLAKRLQYSHIKRQFIPNTCGTGVYEQRLGNPYAFSASSAYINTILQIPGSITPPLFSECINIASYNHGYGGDTLKSLKLLEDHFKYGIAFKKQKDLSILEAITTSSILCFTTNEEGWKNVVNGQLLTKPISSKKDDQDWLSVIVEGYDFDRDCYICKNSWGGETASPRFLFSKSAANDFFFIKVSLSEKVTKKMKPRLEKFKGSLYGSSIDCAWMDEDTAVFGKDYICEYHADRKSDLKFLGYKIDQWISLILQQPKKTELSETSSDSDASDSTSEGSQISPIQTLTTEFIIQLLANKKTLGKGATSTVYRVDNLNRCEGKKFLALKVINEILKTKQPPKKEKKKIWNDEEESDNDSNEEQIEIDYEKARLIFAEYEILNSLNHPNIIKVFGFYFGDRNYEPAILLEYCKFSLESAIGLLEDVDLVGVAYEICSAMMHIHAHKIIHRDLKPQNILINTNKHVKICDFGIAKVLDVTTLTDITHNKGTFLYMAPEMFKLDQIYSQKVDIYAFGVVLYFIVTKGKLPVPEGAGGLHNYTLPAGINEVSKKIITKCWSLEPDKRPSFKKLLRFIVNKNFMLIDGIESKIPNLKEHLGIA